MEFDFNNMQQLNLNTTIDLANRIQQDQQESMRRLEEINRQTYRRREEERSANIETAENTAEMKSDLKEVIHNQNGYIKLLEKQNEILKNMFVSGEDGVAVQKEIMRILQEQGESDGTFKDKGLDAAIQTVFLGVQMWLKSRGIDF